MLRKTAIISGGFGDIGKATAKKFAENGYNIALTYLNSFDAEFVSELKSLGVDVLAMHCDQTNESEIINFVNTAVKEFEFINTFVACAGKAESVELLTEKKTDEIDEIISINLRGTILFVKEVLKVFQKQKFGSIEIVSSIYGQTGGSLESVYSACKAGLIGFVKSIAVEYAPNIRINAVAPGCIETKMTSYLSSSDKADIIASTPLERIGKPEDVANAIYFLSCDESSFITGETITVTGGVVRF